MSGAMDLLVSQLRDERARETAADYKSLNELCKTGEVFGLTCPVCKSPMVICEADHRMMICKKMRDEGFAACSTWLVEVPPYNELEELVVRSKTAPVATWNRKQVKVGVTEKGKSRRLRSYKITGRANVFARDPVGDVFALRFLKKAFGLDRFTEHVTGEAE